MTQSWDAIVVGAGPAGLTAALYLARFRRSTLVLHDGTSRAARIPSTHNVPGWAEGISGARLLARIAAQARKYGASFHEAHVERVEKRESGFTVATAGGATWSSQALLLATGADMNQIPLEAQDHEKALVNRVLGYCPICDGFEHIDQRIGVVGCDRQGAKEALFLRQYSARLTLMPKSFAELDLRLLERLAAAGIAVVQRPVKRYLVSDRELIVRLDDESELSFDVIYPALGLRPRTKLAAALGMALDEGGNVSAKSPFGTHVPGLYAAGDIVAGLDQISVAMGHGAVAATKAHNWMRAQTSQTLPS